MTGNRWIRQSHRWLSIAFTAAVIANFIALARGAGTPSPWVTYSPLPPLFSRFRTPPGGAGRGARAERRQPAQRTAASPADG
jgi:hypothetical protein